MPDESDKDIPQRPLSATERAFMQAVQQDPEMQAEQKHKAQQRKAFYSDLAEASAIENPVVRAEALISGAASLYELTQGGNRQDSTDALQAFHRGLQALEEVEDKDERQKQLPALSSQIVMSGINGEELSIILEGIKEDSIRDGLNLEFIRVNLDSPISFRAAAAQRLVNLYRQSYPHLVDKLFAQRSKSEASSDPFTAARNSEEISEILTQHRTLEDIAQPLLEQGKLLEAAQVFSHSHHGPLRSTALERIALELAEKGQADHAFRSIDDDWDERRVAEEVTSRLVQAGHLDKALAAANAILNSASSHNDGSTAMRDRIYDAVIGHLIDAGKLDEAEKAAQSIPSVNAKWTCLSRVKKARESQE